MKDFDEYFVRCECFAPRQQNYAKKVDLMLIYRKQDCDSRTNKKKTFGMS